MGAELALRQTDGVHHAIQGVELQRVHSNVLAQHLNEISIFGAFWIAVFVDILVVVALHLLDAAAGDELQHVLRGGEVEEGTTEQQRRTADADMHLLGSVVVKHFHIVAQLGATHDAVVAKRHFLALQQSTVGDKLHLGYMLPLTLIHRHETP